MRKMLILLGFVLASGLVFTGCSKDKKVERKLRGSWSVTGKKADPKTQKGQHGTTITFDASLEGSCDLKKNKGTCTYDVAVFMEAKDSTGVLFSQNIIQSVTMEITEWYVEGDLLYFTYEDGTIEVYIIESMTDDYVYLYPYDAPEGSASMDMTFMDPTTGDMIQISFRYEMEMRRK